MQNNYFLNARIDFPSKKEAETALKAIRYDVMNSTQRSITKLKVKNTAFLINIKAKDKTALRASFNSVLKPLILFNDLSSGGKFNGRTNRTRQN
jgi:tRNA threonylcarbamoyladenosine modification (KEOPS) complex  Pcc1 subunit